MHTLMRYEPHAEAAFMREILTFPAQACYGTQHMVHMAYKST